jgi:hypothetical protein
VGVRAPSSASTALVVKVTTAPALVVASTLTLPGTLMVGVVLAGQFTFTLYVSEIVRIPPPLRSPLADIPILYVPVVMPAGTESEIEVEVDAFELALFHGEGSVSVPPEAVIPAAVASALGAAVTVTAAPLAKCGVVLPPPWNETVAFPVKAWATAHTVMETFGPEVSRSPSATN